MKLLLDQNVSRRLVAALSDLFPDSSHVALCNLERADDDRVWKFAKAEGFTIVTKDTDFHQLALFRGPPPKVIWVRLGNCRTHDSRRSCAPAPRTSRSSTMTPSPRS